MSAGRIAAGLAGSIGIPAIIGGGIGAAVPTRAKTKKKKKQERRANIIGGATTGALLGMTIAPAFLGGSSRLPKPRGSAGSGGGFPFHTAPAGKATAKQTTQSSGFSWGSAFGGPGPSPGQQSWRQAAGQGIPKPPPPGQRGGPRPSPSGARGPRIHLPPKEEVEALDIAQKMGLPKKPTSRSEINKVLKTEAKKFHTDVGGDPEKMKDLTRWHSYWKSKVATYLPAFQDGFAEELSKIASL